jgi:NDP-sugar pyrophosphorylase family protein
VTDVQAVILAGGKGTRLRPITTDLPKPLVPIANQPLILHQLRHLAAAGIEDVTLALGYNAERFEPIREAGDELGLRLRIVTEPKPRGTGGALRYCLDQDAFDDRPLLWMNGDVVAAPSVATLLSFHTEHSSNVTLWLTSVRDVSAYGVLELDPDGHVEQFLEKPGPEETDSHLVNAGILMLDPQVLRRIPAEQLHSFEKHLLPAMVENGEPVFGMFDGGYWLDTGQPQLYLAANRHVMEGRVDWWPHGSFTVDGLWEGEGVKREGANIIQPAVLGDGVVVEEGAQIFGRVVLGRNTVVRAGSRLENCVVFDEVEIWPEAEVFNTIVCSGATVGPQATLDGSIIGARSIVGARNQLRHTRLWNDISLADGAIVVDED